METTNSEPQNPIPDIQIPVATNSALQNPTPNKNIYKILFFIFFGLFLATILFSTYLLAKISVKHQNYKTENKITENITSTPIPTETPTPIPTTATDETQDWQTYKNDEYGFSLKYPSNYVIRNTDTKMGADLLFFYKSPYDSNSMSSVPMVTISVENKLDLDIDSWYKKMNKDSIFSGTVKHIQVNGIGCLKYEGSIGESTGTIIYIPHSNMVFSFASSNNSNIDGFTEIYSTFAFTK